MQPGPAQQAAYPQIPAQPPAPPLLPAPGPAPLVAQPSQALAPAPAPAQQPPYPQGPQAPAVPQPTAAQPAGPQPMPQPLSYPAQQQQQQQYLTALRSGTPGHTTGGSAVPQNTQQPGATHIPVAQAYTAPAAGLPLEYPPARPPRSSQPVQALVGGNWIFVVFLPYFVATALQDTHLQLGLIIATATSGIVMLVGLLAFAANMRKVFPHILEVLMLAMYAIMLGVTYRSEPYKREVQRTYNFITHSALAGTCVASLLALYPLGYQHAQELVHRLYMGHPDVKRVGYYSTGVLAASLISADLLYLAPLCKGRHRDHWDGLNLVFRIIYPIVSTFLALLFVRFFPDAYLPNLALVHGIEDVPPPNKPRPISYLADLREAQTPRILDSSMLQSTVDTRTRQVRASAAGPAAAAAVPSLGGRE